MTGDQRSLVLNNQK